MNFPVFTVKQLQKCGGPNLWRLLGCSPLSLLLNPGLGNRDYGKENFINTEK